jgi:integrase
MRSRIQVIGMDETRHAFASWALAAGESPEWVGRTMGHVSTAMIYKTHGRYIPNLTRQDGSALEVMLAQASNERQPE